MLNYYMFNKPAGIVTARTDSSHTTVMDYFKTENNKNLFPVGRLDKDTEGFLIITDDGHFNNLLMSPENHIEKKYFFCALGKLSEESIKQISEGIILEGRATKTLPSKFENINYSTLSDTPEYAKHEIFNKMRHNLPETPVTTGFLTITEGKKHQVKRMLKSHGCFVFYLKRVSIGKLPLDSSLTSGQYRKLSDNEINLLLHKN